jgi:AraC family transcriptional activator of pobA
MLRIKGEKLTDVIPTGDGDHIDPPVYLPKKMTDKQNQKYLARMRKLEGLIDIHFRQIKSPGEYADMMFISERHLNVICKVTVGKSTSDIIMDRIILESKRMLVHSKFNVAEVAAELGYFDKSYFSRMFKKRVGRSPLEFIREYKNQFK